MTTSDQTATASSLLEAIGFAKYRGFIDNQTLELRPITLLFGRNSVGKSAALRCLPILAAAAGAKPTQSVVLDYGAPALRGSSFGDLISNGQISAGLRFNFRWPNLHYEIEIRNLGSDGEALGGFSLKTAADNLRGAIAPSGSSRSGPASYQEFDVSGSASEPTRWRVKGLTPVREADGDPTGAARQLAELLGRFSNSVHWLGAVRAAVPRFFELPLGSEGRISWDGTGVAEALRVSYKAGDGVSEAVSDWLRRTCGYTLTFAATESVASFNREFFPFNVTNGAGSQVAVRDVGEGIAQALPVVTLCHQARVGSLGPTPILAFEQPELHLHPAATVDLANELVDCVSKGSPATHVIETHAESMLLAVQVAIVEKRIAASDIAVHWVSVTDGAAVLRRINFDKEGFAVGGWPPGVFREVLDQARKLSELRLSL